MEPLHPDLVERTLSFDDALHRDLKRTGLAGIGRVGRASVFVQGNQHLFFGQATAGGCTDGLGSRPATTFFGARICPEFIPQLCYR